MDIFPVPAMRKGLFLVFWRKDLKDIEGQKHFVVLNAVTTIASPFASPFASSTKQYYNYQTITELIRKYRFGTITFAAISNLPILSDSEIFLVGNTKP